MKNKILTKPLTITDNDSHYSCWESKFDFIKKLESIFNFGQGHRKLQKGKNSFVTPPIKMSVSSKNSTNEIHKIEEKRTKMKGIMNWWMDLKISLVFPIKVQWQNYIISTLKWIFCAEIPIVEDEVIVLENQSTLEKISLPYFANYRHKINLRFQKTQPQSICWMMYGTNDSFGSYKTYGRNLRTQSAIVINEYMAKRFEIKW